MSQVGWLTRSLADVPSGEAWLGSGERAILARFCFARRRRDWLLGRWTSKLAVAAVTGAAPERIEILAAPDGAPEPYLDGAPAPFALSLSHRAGRALAVVARGTVRVGCDLEFVEPRSGAFLRTWLSPAEQAIVRASGECDAQAANLLWTAKEAAAKLRREGLRLDVRDAVAEIGAIAPAAGAWRALRVEWEGGTIAGWWLAEGDWVMSVAADPAPEQPRSLPWREA